MSAKKSDTALKNIICTECKYTPYAIQESIPIQ